MKDSFQLKIPSLKFVQEKELNEIQLETSILKIKVMNKILMCVNNIKQEQLKNDLLEAESNIQSSL